MKVKKNRLYFIIACLMFSSLIFNCKISVDNQDMFLSFIMVYILAMILGFDLLILKGNCSPQSTFSFILLLFFLVPTFIYNGFNVYLSTSFQYSNYSLNVIVKLILVILVFFVYNEAIKRKYLHNIEILRMLAFSIFLTIPRFYFEFFDNIKLLSLHTQNEFRPYPTWIGGWNTYSLLLSMCFIILFFELRTKRIIRFALLSIVLLTILFTLSRGGLFALFACMLYYYYKRDKKKLINVFLIIMFFLIVLFVLISNTLFMLFKDRFFEMFSFAESGTGSAYLELISSGRTVFWTDIINKVFFKGSFFNIFFGFGVGHYAYLNAQGFIEQGPANQYLMWLYEYGLLLAPALIYVITRPYFTLLWSTNSKSSIILKLIWLVILLRFFTDEVVTVTQSGWLIGILYAMAVNDKNITTKIDVTEPAYQN